MRLAKGLMTAVLALGLARVSMGRATVTELTADGLPAVVLENEFLRAVFSPSKGGTCVDLLYKPANKRMLQKGVGALFGNRVWNYADKDLYFQWQTGAWEHETQTRAGEATLLLRASGKADFTRSTVFEKTVTLRDGESMLRVKYTFSVGQELMVPKKIGLWFNNALGIPGEATRYLCPLDDGMASMDSSTGGQVWLYNPSRGWAGALGESGAGLFFEMEFRRLMCFYLCQGRQPTFEYAFRTMDIKNGASFSTEQLAVAFHGMKAAHGCGGGVVAGFEAPEAVTAAEAARGLPANVYLTAGAPIHGEWRVVLRPLPKGTDVELGRGLLSLAPGSAKTAAFEIRAPKEGTWLLVGTFSKDGQELMDFIKPINIGKASAPVRIAAREERLGNPKERFEDRAPLAGAAPKDLTYSTEIETPHVRWAKPLAGGRLKVLVLTSCLTGREAAELAQRLDMDLIWVTAGSQQELDGIAYLFNTPTRKDARYLVAHMNANIKQALAGPCDAIVIGGLPGDIFSDEVVALMRKKVSEGAGLVSVSPTKGSDKFYELLPVERETHRRLRLGAWQSVKPHYLTTGVPFEALPATDYVNYKAKGETVAVAAKKPLVIVQDGPDKGRVAVLAYNTGWQGSGAYMSGITPWVEEARLDYPYWEQHFSLLCKAIVWAARREQPVNVTSITAKGDASSISLTLKTANSGGPKTLDAEITAMDAFGRVTARCAVKAAIVAGDGETTIRAPAPKAVAGLTLVSAILRDEQGRSVWWGTATCETPSALKIEGLSLDKKTYDPGETVKASFRSMTTNGQSLDATVRAELTDSLGRLIFRQEKKVRLSATATPIGFDAPLGAPLATTATLRV
ncbi:MAG TPA: hypothetical protein P5137_12555, partial [Candidatus Brocadiia bacterium]|nr:hypothetical protein [Candidatus Brocadiia bacterium]